jgi:predicted transcriptional regulator
MPEPITRDGILDALRDMPPDATIDHAVERRLFLARVEAGLAELDADEAIAHDEAKRPLRL